MVLTRYSIESIIIKQNITEFHNEIAPGYDGMVNTSIPANAIRDYFQKRILAGISKGEQLLEIGCGTGTDAVFLAKNGIKITATDISENMLKITESKAKESKLSDLINTEMLDGDNLASFKGRTFDGLISNLNAVNYIKDIKSFSGNAAHVLVPGAKVFLIMLNKICLWEILYNIVKLKPVTALGKLTDRKKDYKTEMHLYFPRKIKKIFSQYFYVNKITGFGFFYPPDGLSPFQKKHGKFFSAIQPLERFVCSAYPFYNLCDHYLIEMTRK